MFRAVVFAAVAGFGMVGVAGAHGSGGVSVSIGIGTPGFGAVVRSAPPRYYRPAPVYAEVPGYAPAPIYRVRPPVVYAPPPVVYYPPQRIVYPGYGGRYIDEREWRGHGGPWHGEDRYRDHDDGGGHGRWRGDRDGRH